MRGEIIQDDCRHTIGEREVVNWTRADGCTYFNVPIVYVRESTAAEYLAQPHLPHPMLRPGAFYWEVVTD